MNLILLLDNDFVSPSCVVIRDRRRVRHIVDVHAAKVGDQLRIGRLNGLMGSGTITRLDNECIEFNLSLEDAPPAPLPLTLILALPRPKMLKRILLNVSKLGDRKCTSMNSCHVT